MEFGTLSVFFEGDLLRGGIGVGIVVTEEQLSSLRDFCRFVFGFDFPRLEWQDATGLYRSGKIEEPEGRHWISHFISRYEVVVGCVPSDWKRRLPIRAQLEVWIYPGRATSGFPQSFEVALWYDSKNEEWILDKQAYEILDGI